MISLIILTNCAKMMDLNDPNNHASFCQIAKPIYWDDADTDATIIQVKQYNKLITQLCGAL